MENSPQTNAFSISLKVLTGLCMVIYMSTLFTNKDKDVTVASTTPEANQTNVLEIPGNITKRTKSVIIQPSSLKPDELIILDDILKEYVLEKTMCRPEDVTNLKKHKVPKAMSKTNKITEPKGMMVVYIAVGLLLTSLGAAFVEVFKAKQQPTTKSKPALARRCSLADLTVLRHNRKEMMRRDSIMDMVDHRGAPKLLDHRSLFRRCSFPVSPGDYSKSFGSLYRTHGARVAKKRTSVIETEGLFPLEHKHAHIRLLHRH